VKIRPEQLSSRLVKPAPIYLFASEEPLLTDEALDVLRARARELGIVERQLHVVERGFDWDELQGDLANRSLFSAGKLVEIRLSGKTPGDEGSRAIRELAARPADDNLVVIVVPGLDGKTRDSAWVKSVAAAGGCFEFDSPRLEDLPAWISRRLHRAGLQADEEAAALIAERVEGNLLAARQEVEKLALLFPAGTTITVAEVRDAVADGARYDVFQLADAALAGELPRALRVLAGLRGDGTAPPLILWALVREIITLADVAGRQATGMALPRAIAAAGVWESRRELVGAAVKRRPPGGMSRLLVQAARADRVVKGARPGNAWNALTELTLGLAGHGLAGGELQQ
jgi:DNA polymerase III subunit delta